jgi:hypothetical protein
VWGGLVVWDLVGVSLGSVGVEGVGFLLRCGLGLCRGGGGGVGSGCVQSRDAPNLGTMGGAWLSGSLYGIGSWMWVVVVGGCKGVLIVLVVRFGWVCLLGLGVEGCAYR